MDFVTFTIFRPKYTFLRYCKYALLHCKVAILSKNRVEITKIWKSKKGIPCVTPNWHSRSHSLKGARSDHFRFVSNFQKIWYQKKACNFLITPGEFYGWKMYRLENIYENETIIRLTRLGIGNCEIHDLFLFKPIDRFNWNLKPRFLGWWRMVWIKISILRNWTRHL